MDRKALAGTAGTAVVVGIVAAIGIWARGQPSEVPLRISPLPVSEVSRGPDPRPLASAPALPSAPKKIAVDIEGAVRTPGLYWVSSEERVLDLITRAGGIVPGGDGAALNLALPLKDGMKIVVPFARSAPGSDAPAVPPPDNPAPAEPISDPQPIRTGGRKGDDLAPGSIAINRATAEEFARLPGIGPATAAKIVAERERRGGFTKVEDLMSVPGIGQKKLEKIAPFLTL